MADVQHDSLSMARDLLGKVESRLALSCQCVSATDDCAQEALLTDRVCRGAGPALCRVIRDASDRPPSGHGVLVSHRGAPFN